jgi:DNA repair protein RAD51
MKEVEEQDGPTMIEALEQEGVSMKDIEKLKEAGYNTVEAITFTPRKALVLVKGLSEAKLDKILEAAAKLVKMGFQTAGTYLEQRKD